MASLHCSASPHPFQSVLGFRRPTCRADIPAIMVLQPGAKASPTPSHFRFKNAIRLEVKQRLLAVFSSKSNPSDGDSLKEKYNGIKTDDDAKGPPFLTILAGLLVFLFICWIIGSILLWLIGLIVHSPPSK